MKRLLTILLFLALPLTAGAQVSGSLWKLQSNELNPVNASWSLQIPGLASPGSPCVSVSSTGDFATTTCGSGSSSTFGTTSISALLPLLWNTSTAQLSTLFSTSTTWNLGNNGLVMTNSTGVPFVTATSSAINLNISGNAGTVTNGVYTTTFNSLFDPRFVTDLAATSSVASITTLPSLSLPYSQLTSTPVWFGYPFPSNATTTTLGFANITATGATTTTIAATANGAGCAQFNADGALISTGSVCATATTYTATYPITLTGSAFGLAFGTTTSNTWAGTQTFTNPIVDAALTGLIAGNSGTTYAVSTTSMNASITGSSGSVANSVTFNSSGAGGASPQVFNGSSAETISYNTIGAQVAGTYDAVITASAPIVRSINNLIWTGLATTSQPSSSNLLTSNGAAGVYGTATSTLSTSSPLTGSFVQVGSGGSLGCQTASGSQAGCLSSTDWNTFNNKVSSTFGTTSISASLPLVWNTSTAQLSTLFSTSTTWGIGNNGLVMTGATGIPFSQATSSTIALSSLNLGTLVATTINGTDLSLGTNSVSTNIAVGSGALSSGSLSGGNNTATGSGSLNSDTTGANNTAFGNSALVQNTTGSNNTATGYVSLNSDTTGANNTAFGNSALGQNTTGSNNSAVGYQALLTNTTGSNNVGIGAGAGNSGTGVFTADTFIGVYTGGYNGSTPIASSTNIGYEAGFNSSGNLGTLVGYQAGASITSAIGDIVLGQSVTPPSNTTGGLLDVGNVLFGSGMYSTDAVSSYPTANSTIGIASSTPWGEFAISALSGSVYPSNQLFIIASSTSNSTTTLFSVNNTGAITASALTAGTGNGALCATSGGLIEYSSGANCVATAAGAPYPFTPLTNYGLTNSATTSPIWAQLGLNASSTSHFDQIQVGSTTANNNGGMATSTFFGNVDVKGNLADEQLTTSDLVLDNSGGVLGSYAGSNCSTGQSPTGINGAGAVQNCTTYTQNGLTAYDAWTHPSAGISATTSSILINNATSTITQLTMVVSTTTNATTTSLEIGQTASTTRAIVSNLGSSATTNVCASVAGVLQITGCNNGTLTAVGITTNQGVSGTWSSPNLTISLGALTGVTSFNGLVVTANTGAITTGSWAGTAIPVAYGGTGGSGPGNNLVLYSNSGDTAFAGVATTTTGVAGDIVAINALSGTTITYASTTAMTASYASSTLLSIGTAPNGEASTSVSTPTGNIFLVHDWGGPISSSTLSYMGAYGTSGTTTIAIQNPLHSTTMKSYYCKTDVGTAYVGFGTGSATTTETQCTTSGTQVTTSSNNTWTGRQTVFMDIGHEATSPNIITVTASVEDSN